MVEPMVERWAPGQPRPLPRYPRGAKRGEGQLRQLATAAPGGLGTSLCTLAQAPPALRLGLAGARMCTLGGGRLRTAALPDLSQLRV